MVGAPHDVRGLRKNNGWCTSTSTMLLLLLIVLVLLPLLVARGVTKITQQYILVGTLIVIPRIVACASVVSRRYSPTT